MAELSRNEMLLLSQLGYTLYKEGQYEKAISFFKGLSEMQPDLPQFHTVLAVLHHITDDPEAALKEALRASELKPNDISILITLGEIYLTLKQSQRAKDVLNQAYTLAKQGGHPAIVRISLMLQSAR